MNACGFCKRAKRKCDKARPSCSNCIRLKRHCFYTEDALRSPSRSSSANGSDRYRNQQPSPAVADFLGISGPLNAASPLQSVVAIALHAIGSADSMGAVSSGFFSGTHQRIPALSKIRFYQKLQSLTATPDADFATLCLSILLLQQFPTGPASSVQSPLYTTVKGLTTILEASSDVSIDLVHCRVLVAFYEMGHGLHTAAYVSIAAAARLARVLGLHRKSWRHCHALTDNIMLEEKKRVWWAITNMDRFVNLCSGDAFFVTNESERSDPLPIEDLLWSETLDAVALEDMITRPPTLDTPFDTRVGQMARECQIFHLVGRVVRHVFDPLPDQDFNAEEAVLLERTLKAYLPLLANEELEIGKYCGAFGACNSALFILYEFMLSRCDDSSVERARLVHAIQETSISAITFAEATHRDRSENYPIETQSPYLIYSLYQAAVVQHRLWKQHRDPQWRRNIESLREIIYAFTGQYLERLERLQESWPPLALPFQGVFISSGHSTITT